MFSLLSLGSFSFTLGSEDIDFSEDIDLDNYILVIGCSQTEGIGLKIEDTYPYLLSKNLNCDYYNLGICGTGIDVLNYNLVTWFTKIKKPPKLLIYIRFFYLVGGAGFEPATPTVWRFRQFANFLF